MIVALSLLACTNNATDPVDPIDPTVPTEPVPTEPVTPEPAPPLSTFAVESAPGEGHVTFSDHAGIQGGWSVDLALIGSGRRGETVPSPIAPLVEDHRATYAYPGFTEWYQTTDIGTKHGLEITEKPQGAGRLRYVYQVSSELLPVQDDGQILFFDANSQVRFNYADIYTFDANGAEVPSWMELDCTDSCTISLVVDDAEAVYPITIDPLAFSNERVLIQPDNDTNTNFGRSVDIAGSFAIVGAHLADTAGSRSGEAYVYQRSGTAWNLIHRIPGLTNGEECGNGVAISTNRLLVGCPGADAGGTERGLARVYSYTSSTLTFETELISTLAVDGQRMGYTVDLDDAGTRAIVGGWGRRLAGGSTSDYRPGVASIFEFATGSWSLINEFSPLDQFAFYGYAVGITGDYAVVGAPQANGSDGQVYLYERLPGPVWSQDAVFDGNSSVGELGTSVAIDGTTAVAGAPRNAGSVNVYTRNAGWGLQQNLVQTNAQPDDRFGVGVGLHINRVVVGAIRDDSATSDDRDVGSMVVFDRAGSFWTEQVEVLTRYTDLNNNPSQTNLGFDSAVSGAWAINGSLPNGNLAIETAHLYQITDCLAVTGQSGCNVELLITEVHPDPLGGSNEEFIEIYNGGSNAVQLQGAQMVVNGTPFTFTDSFVVGAGRHAVITKSRDSSVNGGIEGVPGMYVDNSWTLGASATVSLIGTDASTLATMTYSGFATPAASLQLSFTGGDYADPSASYTAFASGNWCPTFSPYVPGDNSYDFMSPRQVNEACGKVIDFDYFYSAVNPVDDNAGSTFITLLGNRFTTGNSGEGDLIYTASAAGQVMRIVYDNGTELDNAGSPRAFGASCFTSFEADPGTFPPPNPTPGPNYYPDYETGDFNNLVCN